MSRELINRITRKKDGVYISTHSSNDDAPYHSVKIDFLTDIYNQEVQKKIGQRNHQYVGEERMVYISDFNSIPKLNWKNRKGDEKIIWDSIINL